MSAVVRIDEKGRIVIPKNVRVKANLREGDLVKIILMKDGIILKPLGSIADKYFGAYRVEKWPKDLDKFLIEAVIKWWHS